MVDDRAVRFQNPRQASTALRGRVQTAKKLSSVGGATGALTPTTQKNSTAGVTPPPAPTPAPKGGGGSRGGGGGSTIDTTPVRQEERYWWQPDWNDSAYNAQIAAINRAIADYETELGLRGERYGTDYVKGLRQLGFRPGEEFKPTVDIASLLAGTGAPAAAGLAAARTSTPELSGTWDYEGEFDPTSAAARGTRTSRDEFAGRGTLRSSDFAKAFRDFQSRLLEQRNAMETGRTRFFEDAATELAKERASAEERRQAARVNAMARAAGQGEYRTR